MKKHHSIYISKRAVAACGTTITLVVAAALLDSCHSRGQAAEGSTPQQSDHTSNASAGTIKAANSAVDLSPSQLNAIKIEPVGTYEFPVERETVGNISFADELSVQVFPAYQGTIIKAFVELGAQVEKDQPLYTIKSPDLIQAESTLIGAAATFELTNKELDRVKGLPGIAQRELEQATSDQQTADGALKAARDAVLVFGKTDAEIDQMIASRKIDPALVVHSPISGQITSYAAPPGLLVQPGNPPAPYTVSNVSVKWMLANVIESDMALLHLGEPVQVKVMAYPNRVFRAKVSKIYPMVDPNTHRATVRSEIEDPRDELRPGMLANFVIRVDGPMAGIAVPANGVVREPDGAMTAWVTTDRRHFEQRIIKTGLRRDDRVQILGGLLQGELVVTDGAVFLSSMLSAPPIE
ncbi:MAG: efflux RND transporter periplasmic adaptor subunit [Bryobacteraceae bacterium]|jgi:cobalt-zinc-cadmium efflux system membrane fusion protein